MIVDLNRKLVILGNRKCASTSLQDAFGKFASFPNPLRGEPGRYTRIAVDDDVFPLASDEALYLDRHFKHLRGPQMRFVFEKLGLDYDSFKKVVCIRDPFERALSHYRWEIGIQKNPEYVQKLIDRGPSDFVLRTMDFWGDGLPAFTGHTDRDYRRDGFLIVRTEFLHDDLARVWREIPDNGPLLEATADLPHANRTEAAAGDLSPTARRRLEEIFAEDLRVGGYRQEDRAGRMPLRPRLARTVLSRLRRRA